MGKVCTTTGKAFVSWTTAASCWVIVGDGEEKDHLRCFSREKGLLDKVLFTGWVTREELVEYLKQADVFALPTYAEGFSNAMLEAMAAGLPVTTTPVGGIPGFITNGGNGILVPPRDSARLAEATVKLAKFRRTLVGSLSRGFEHDGGMALGRCSFKLEDR